MTEPPEVKHWKQLVAPTEPTDEPPIVYMDRQPDGRLRIACPNCSWYRDFGTARGALTTLTQHRIDKHRISTTWNETPDAD